MTRRSWIEAAALATILGPMAGCRGTITVGEVRRRKLFRSLLLAWVLGLALAWRWWSRSRPRPPTG